MPSYLSPDYDRLFALFLAGDKSVWGLPAMALGYTKGLAEFFLSRTDLIHMSEYIMSNV